jgi:hypothetical protein
MSNHTSILETVSFIQLLYMIRLSYKATSKLYLTLTTSIDIPDYSLSFH